MARRLFSCDTHLEHSADHWLGYVSDKSREVLGEPMYSMPVCGKTGLFLNACAGIAYEERGFDKHDPYTEKLPGTWGGTREYLGWLDQDQTEVAVVHPGVPYFANAMTVKHADRDAYLDIVRGYNNWLSDFCSAAPGRLLGAAPLPGSGLEDDLAELRRVRELPGIATVGPTNYPNGTNRPAPEDDPFWAEALALDMPITLHLGVGQMFWQGGIGGWEPKDFAVWITGRMEFPYGGGYSTAQILLSGVFDRFPDLRFLVCEAGAGWIPFFANGMDDGYTRHRHWADFPELKKMPSEYIREGNFLWNVMADYASTKMLDLIGVENLSFAIDFPHSHSLWPNSQKVADKLVEGLSDDVADQILWTNAARFYRQET